LLLAAKRRRVRARSALHDCGPSRDPLLIADAEKIADWIALDLLSQAEQ